eukprot:s3549_g4.t1
MRGVASKALCRVSTQDSRGGWSQSDWSQGWEWNAPQGPWRAAEESQAAGDPLLSMSLKSLEQLLAGSSSEQDRALPSLLERLQRQISGSADVSPAQLVSCLQLLRGVDAPRLLGLVAPRAAAAAGSLAPQELVDAARALAHCAHHAATADLARALGTVMAEALCRHRGLSLEQLAALAASPAPRRGAVLQALLLHAEVDRPPDDAPEDEDAALAATLDRLADQASSLAPEDLVLSLAGLAVLAVRDDLAAAVLCEDLASRLPVLGCSELALLSWAFGYDYKQISLQVLQVLQAVGSYCSHKILAQWELQLTPEIPVKASAIPNSMAGQGTCFADDKKLLDPKVPLAVERTLLRWLRSAVILASLSAFLMGLRNKAARVNGGLLAVAAMIMVTVPVFKFLRRSLDVSKAKAIQPMTDRSLVQVIGALMAGVLLTVLLVDIVIH